MGKRAAKKSLTKRLHSVVIATFSSWKNHKRTPTNGMIEPLLSFFCPKSAEVTLIDCPHPGSDQLIPQIEIYQKNKLTKSYSVPFLFPPLFILQKFNELKTQPAFKLRDLFTVLEVLLFKKEKTDLFIGLESINTLAGIILKKLGKIKTVVYYVSDYSPSRYQSKFFNKLYLWLDQFCATHADYIWDVSLAMMPARIKAGLQIQKSAPLIHVPNALFPWQISYQPREKLQPLSLVFAGTVGPENGLDLAIEAVALAKIKFPDIKLHVYGSGLKKDEQLAQKLICKYKLENNVFNHGFIADLKLLSKELSRCLIGLAPYRAIPSSVRWYADATKLRLYLACGLPVISTQVPPLAHETAKLGCTLIAKDNIKEYGQAIVSLLESEEKYKKMRLKAIQYAKNNLWENVYRQALFKMSRS